MASIFKFLLRILSLIINGSHFLVQTVQNESKQNIWTSDVFFNARYTTCGTGYTLNFQTGNCEDDDECAHGHHNCDALGPGYFCRNIKVKKI